MNKFQKVACKCAKDDMKKEIIQLYGFNNFKRLKSASLQTFKRFGVNYKKALEFKNFNKLQMF
ncbi:hypothetical protein [Clostridium botulinum]|uniref:hypothetical protein n=1 Tax=Clostridium botulinum TaxID=1491 RepID=UPI001C9B52FA|nr:hypothetical protein [Clostridium botulinum]MBY6860766.1 hypothetical protein [Clostridium botulinum]MBY7043845.1 hypothetical protein [Clostridium botulinum]